MDHDAQDAMRDWLNTNKYTALEYLTGESRLRLVLRLQIELSPEDEELLRQIMARGECPHINFNVYKGKCPDCGITRKELAMKRQSQRPWRNPYLRGDAAAAAAAYGYGVPQDLLEQFKRAQQQGKITAMTASPVAPMNAPPKWAQDGPIEVSDLERAMDAMGDEARKSRRKREAQDSLSKLVSATLPRYERERELDRQREAEMLAAFATQQRSPAVAEPCDVRATDDSSPACPMTDDWD